MYGWKIFEMSARIAYTSWVLLYPQWDQIVLWHVPQLISRPCKSSNAFGQLSTKGSHVVRILAIYAFKPLYPFTSDTDLTPIVTYVTPIVIWLFNFIYWRVTSQLCPTLLSRLPFFPITMYLPLSLTKSHYHIYIPNRTLNTFSVNFTFKFKRPMFTNINNLVVNIIGSSRKFPREHVISMIVFDISRTFIGFSHIPQYSQVTNFAKTLINVFLAYIL